MLIKNRENQKKFKEKMYKNGFKQMIVWVKRREAKTAVKMNQREFISNVKKLTAGWDDDTLSQLYSLLIKIVKAKKEANRLKENK